MSEVRVRRHTDGRVALHIQDDDYYRWSSWKLNDRYTRKLVNIAWPFG